MRRIGISLVIVLALGLSPVGPGRWLSGGPARARAAEDPATVRKKFEAFVASWMDKLRERERFNVSHVKWRSIGGRVEGVYTGYDTTNYRILPLTNVETMPIGKLVYLELKLRLIGDTEDAARAGRPEVVERVEVTELFRYDRGKWVY